MKKIQLFISFALLANIVANAQVPLESRVIRPTAIAPAFFGPYAYPVPDLDEAKTSDKLTIQLAGDACIGHVAGRGDNRDYTYAPTFKIVIPLWTDRVNLNCWGELHEWWHDTPATRDARRYDPKYDSKTHGNGQIWLGLDMLVLREKEHWPSIVLSINMLTAAGGNYPIARHYDAPGYHFTVSIGKNLTFQDETALRFSFTGGFVCWQTNRGSQNDAWMFGGKVSYNHPFFTLGTEYATYIGWEIYGDAPQTLKVMLDFNLKNFAPFIYYAHGIKDWPFDQIRCGLKYKIPLPLLR